MFLTVFVVLLFIYLIVCVINYHTMKFPAKIEFVKQHQSAFFDGQPKQFLEYHQQMLANDFVLIDTLYANQLNLDNYVALYQHPTKAIVADITHIKHQTMSINCVYAEFVEFFADGCILSINNNDKIPLFFRANPKLPKLLFATQSISELLAAQSHIRQKLKPNVASINPLQYKPIKEIFNDYLKAEYEYLVKVGYLKPKCDDSDVYRPTVWGVLNTAWQYMPIMPKLLLKYQHYVSKSHLNHK